MPTQIGIYIGLITAYHGETIQPISDDALWKDRKNVQLAFSRNGVTWQRVGPNGAIPTMSEYSDVEWREIADGAVFLPYGKLGLDWDAGVIHTYQPPVVVRDEIRIYYQGHNGRNWWNYDRRCSEDDEDDPLDQVEAPVIM